MCNFEYTKEVTKKEIENAMLIKMNKTKNKKNRKRKLADKFCTHKRIGNYCKGTRICKDCGTTWKSMPFRDAEGNSFLGG